jgi:hypothetical protein
MIEIKRIEQNDLEALSMLYYELSEEKTDFDIMVKNFECIEKNEFKKYLDLEHSAFTPKKCFSGTKRSFI